MGQGQLPLNLGLKDHALFASFVAGENTEVVDYLQHLQSSRTTPCTYLWGATASGKSHLLQAVCHAAGRRQQAAVYLPMATLQAFAPDDALAGLEDMAVICIDDIQEIAGSETWEKALFALFVRMRPEYSRLIIAGSVLPGSLGLSLQDLTSRLNGGLVFALRPLDDETMLEALLLRARRRGMNLAPPVGRYLVSRFGDSMSRLIETLETLDKASLIAKRKVTIPFIRQAMGLTPEK